MMIRIYRILLRAFPEDFRAELGLDMEAHFEDALSDARNAGALAATSVFLRASIDVVTHGVLERVRVCVRRRPKRTTERKRGAVVPLFLRDFRQTFRSLVASPGFSLTAVATLALGTGATTAVFSIVNGVLLRPLPYPEPERLVRVFEQAPGIPEFPLAPGNLLDYRREESFEALAAYRRDDAELSGGTGSERLPGMRVTAAFFDVLGIAPIAGRPFREESERRGSDTVVLLSERLWTRRFNRDPAVVGSSITLDGSAHVVLGVLPEGLTHVGGVYHSMPAGSIVDVWRPYGFAEEPRRGAHFLNGIARLRDGVDLSQAASAMDALSARLAEAHPESNAEWSTRLVPLHEAVVRDTRGTLLLLSGTVGLVLLVTAVNLTGLLLARGETRKRDFALKAALGAARGRLVTEMLLESSLVALAGGLFGLVGASVLIRAVPHIAPVGLPRLGSIEMDGTVLAVALGVTTLTGLIVGLVPALSLSRNGLQLGTTRTSPGGNEKKLRSGFVVAQIALALTLLVGAGLLLRTLVNLQDVEPGFEADGVVTARVFLPRGRYPDETSNIRLFTRLLEEMRGIGGVTAAGAGSDLPWSGYDENIGVSVEGRPMEERYGTRYHFMMPGYFETLGIPTMYGRTFSTRDDDDAPARIVVNRRLAEQIFGAGVDPTGARLSLTTQPAEDDWMTVIGVVGDVKDGPSARAAEPAMYLSHAQTPWNDNLFLAMRVGPGSTPALVLDALRERLDRIDRDLPLTEVSLLEERTREALAPYRFVSGLTVSLAAAALGVALLGLYGVVAQTVASETRAMAIRLALGASATRVLGQVLFSALRLVFLGAALGLVMFGALGRTLESFLFEVTEHDLLTLVAATLLLAATAATAAYLPARRAAKVEPTLALRHE